MTTIKEDIKIIRESLRNAKPGQTPTRILKFKNHILNTGIYGEYQFTHEAIEQLKQKAIGIKVFKSTPTRKPSIKNLIGVVESFESDFRGDFVCVRILNNMMDLLDDLDESIRFDMYTITTEHRVDSIERILWAFVSTKVDIAK